MTQKPIVKHAGCGGRIVPVEGGIVCTRCKRDVPNQMEWVHEPLVFKRPEAAARLDAVTL